MLQGDLWIDDSILMLPDLWLDASTTYSSLCSILMLHSDILLHAW